MVQYLGQKLDKSHLSLDTPSGILQGQINCQGDVQVEQGSPKPIQDEPLSLTDYGLDCPGYPVDIGNPHLVIFLKESPCPDLVSILGPRLETHPFFPSNTNVEFCYLECPGTVMVLMWERGAGRTQACGSGACAVAFVAIKVIGERNSVRVRMEGGDLLMSLDDKGVMSHRGQAQFVFSGVFKVNSQ